MGCKKAESRLVGQLWLLRKTINRTPRVIHGLSLNSFSLSLMSGPRLSASPPERAVENSVGISGRRRRLVEQAWGLQPRRLAPVAARARRSSPSGRSPCWQLLARGSMSAEGQGGTGSGPWHVGRGATGRDRAAREGRQAANTEGEK
jgi:hypothetical protein